MGGFWCLVFGAFCRSLDCSATTSSPPLAWNSVSNASHMKIAQKPRGTARFRRYERVSVCGIWQWRRHSCLLSQRDFFWCLVRLASDQVSDVGTSGSGHSTISGRFSPADNPRCLSSVWISSSWSRSGETELLLRKAVAAQQRPIAQNFSRLRIEKYA
jgi:hypothetical protein